MAEGRSNAGIGEELVITERSVEKHINSIFHKLQLPVTTGDNRRVIAVLRYLDSGRRDAAHPVRRSRAGGRRA